MTDFWESFSAPKIHSMILYSETAPFVLFAWTWLPPSSRFSNYVSAARKWIIYQVPCICIWSLYSGLCGAGTPKAEQSRLAWLQSRPPTAAACGVQAAKEPTAVPAPELPHHRAGKRHHGHRSHWGSHCKHLTTTKPADLAKLAKFRWATAAERVTDTKEAPQLQELWHACRNNGTELAAGGDYGNNHCRVKSRKGWSQRNESNRES